MTPPVRVLLVDDDLFVRTELAELLAGQDGLELIGACADGRAAVQAAETLKPDVILMDIQLPHLNGAQATRAICQRNPDQIVLALTSLAGDQLVDLMLDAGARGYLVKSTRVSAMAHAIRAAAEGLAVLPVRNREVGPPPDQRRTLRLDFDRQAPDQRHHEGPGRLVPSSDRPRRTTAQRLSSPLSRRTKPW